MKFVKRISLFFIYPAVMFTIGAFSGGMAERFFYPGEGTTVKEKQKETEEGSEDTVIETGYQKTPVLTADTDYIVMTYDAFTGEMSEKEENAPQKYVGLTREELQQELELYEKSPSLTDQEEGLSGVELLSFSGDRVVVRKNYEKAEEGYYLVCEDHKVVVYDRSLTHMYLNTGILLENLPWELQNEIIHMKLIRTESELYHFLESYSS